MLTTTNIAGVDALLTFFENANVLEVVMKRNEEDKSVWVVNCGGTEYRFTSENREIMFWLDGIQIGRFSARKI